MAHCGSPDGPPSGVFIRPSQTHWPLESWSQVAYPETDCPLGSQQISVRLCPEVAVPTCESAVDGPDLRFADPLVVQFWVTGACSLKITYCPAKVEPPVLLMIVTQPMYPGMIW